ncbi:SARP family transcriptional regulator [Longispora fulva]|uniref:DNA-binding SARP family transcriptional activator/Tfp pilus assembly protein PilF n=1 Tax=Longispora fulva TaxID=619741 RepID=A0A8J7GNU2_9ACTN|nr:BTAD domain-containing putative transcriptional regulator [Longispora fulva]MBG6136094.1 DNA-binding SARP family transcriptional activator/Tfp pilus assembly protein PilF [Longispora fulva]GIG55661.1 SARP family transcriptional regulator [Longispora fulva]
MDAADLGEPVRVQLLGRLRVWRGATEIAVRPGQQRAIVALLALANGQPVRRDQLIGALWTSATIPAGAWNVVQTHVKRLRSALEPDRTARQSSRLLPRAGDGYALRVEDGAVDLHHFAQLTARARDAQREGNAADAFALLRQAQLGWCTPLTDVPLLADHPAVADTVRQRWLSIGWFAAAALDLGRAGDVLALVDEAAREHPLDEDAQARLIRVYRALGRRDEAMASFREVRARLVDELGVEPGAQLHEAYQGLLEPTPTVSEGTVAASPRIAQLPADIPDFTGRRDELAILEALLGEQEPAPGTPDADRVPTVIALVGMGGVGKTTLALRAAHRAANRFPDGQLYATLRGSTTSPARPDDLLATLLMSLGVAGSAVPDGLEERAALYRSRLAGRRVLIVLDDAAAVSQVRPLLPGTPPSAVIVTSRDRLSALAEARTVAVDVLGDSDALRLLRRMAGERWAGADPDAVRDILDTCAGVPLALRVVGARLASRPDRPLGWLAERLSDSRRRLDELRTGDLAVRSSLMLSYDGTSPQARRALRLLALLDVNDVADWVVAALLDTTTAEAESLVDVLVDAHLVEPNGTDATGSPRYRLHDLVRLFARERAYATDTRAIRGAAISRAVGAWLTLAEAADVRLSCRYLSRRIGPAHRWPVEPHIAERLAAAPEEWFAAERANLLAAIDHAASAGDGVQAWNLADAALGFYEMRDLRDDWLRSHETAWKACSDSDMLGRAVLARNLAYRASAAHVCDLPRLRKYAEQSHDAFARLGDDGGRAEALVLRAEVHRASGEQQLAARLFRGALALAADAGDKLVASVAHNEMALLLRECGKAAEAARHYEESLRLCAAHGNRRPRYTALRMLAMTAAQAGDAASAEALFDEALAIARAMGSPVKQAAVLRELGGFLLKLGRLDGAGKALDAALELAVPAGVEVERAFTIRWSGVLDLRRGQSERARAQLYEAVEIFERAGLAYPTALALRDLGVALVACGDVDGARESWSRARQMYVQLANAAAITEIDALCSGLVVRRV